MGKKDKKGGRTTPPTPAGVEQAEGPRRVEIQVDPNRQLYRVTMQRDELQRRNDWVETALEEKVEEIQQMRAELDQLTAQIMGGKDGQGEEGATEGGGDQPPSGPDRRPRSAEGEQGSGGGKGHQRSAASGKRAG